MLATRLETNHQMVNKIANPICQICLYYIIHIKISRLSELNFALKDIKVDPDEYTTESIKDDEEDMERYLLAKSFFDLNEYDR